MNYKKYIISSIAISSTILILILATSITLSLVIAHQEDLKFCLSPGCFDFAAKALQEPIKIFKVGVEFGTYAFAAIGAATAIMTYMNTVKSEKHNRHLQKYNEYNNYTSDLLSRENSGIRHQNINTNLYYNLLFPESINAIFAPSKRYEDIIKKLADLIVTTNTNYTPSDDNTIAHHCREALKLIEQLGITMEEPTEERLILLEPKILIFIDNINKKFTNTEIRLERLTRDYSRHF